MMVAGFRQLFANFVGLVLSHSLNPGFTSHDVRPNRLRWLRKARER